MLQSAYVGLIDIGSHGITNSVVASNTFDANATLHKEVLSKVLPIIEVALKVGNIFLVFNTL